MFLELLVVLGCILLGIRLGGIGLGAAGGIGLVILVFGFGLPPGSPPGTVLGMIVAVITTLAALQSAGGLDYLVHAASGVMAQRPQSIATLAPLFSFLLVAVSGTQHVMYALMPVIVNVSMKANIRPERALAMSVVASQYGLICSPIAAVTVALMAATAGFGLSLGAILTVAIPASIVGMVAGIASTSWKSSVLNEDPEYLRRIEAGDVAPPTVSAPPTGAALRNARISLSIFALAIACVVLVGVFPDMRPTYEIFSAESSELGQVDTGRAIMMIMLAAAGLIMLFCKVKPDEAVRGSIMRGGIVALISILGVSWMGSSFFEGNRNEIVTGVAELIKAYPWVLALGLFVMSVLLMSQAATVTVLIPVAVALGLPASAIIGAFPAVNGMFFLPTYGTVLAAVSFDSTGSTRIGKYLLNHSFMLPGLVTLVASTLTAMLIAQFVL